MWLVLWYQIVQIEGLEDAGKEGKRGLPWWRSG